MLDVDERCVAGVDEDREGRRSVVVVMVAVVSVVVAVVPMPMPMPVAAVVTWLVEAGDPDFDAKAPAGDAVHTRPNGEAAIRFFGCEGLLGDSSLATGFTAAGTA